MAAVIVEVPEPVVAVVKVPRATVADASVKVSVSPTLAVTVICPAVDDATFPVSTAVVHASSEYVVSLIKNVEFVALGLVTPENATVWLPAGAATLPVFLIRRLPAVPVFTVQPVASPRFVGCADRVDVALVKPAGVVQAPLAVVQAVASKEASTVAEGTVKVNV